MKTLAEKERTRRIRERRYEIWEDESVVTWKPRKMPRAIAAPKT